MASGEIVVCEGYTDVIGFFQAGLPRAVATCGTALAEEHFTLLRNFARRIVLAYDADSAGQTATGRVYEWERNHEVDVFVAALPAGSDPGELAQDDPEALRQRGRPTPAVPAVPAGSRAPPPRLLDTAEGRARAADEAIAVIAEHPSDLVRDQYVMTVSDRCRLEPDLLRSRLDEARRAAPVEGDGRRARSGRSRPTAGGPVANEPGEDGGWDRPAEDEGEAPPRRSPHGPDPASRPGLEALRFAVHRPEAVADRLEAVLFVDELQRRAFLDAAGGRRPPRGDRRRPTRRGGTVATCGGRRAGGGRGDDAGPRRCARDQPDAHRGPASTALISRSPHAQRPANSQTRRPRRLA